MAWQAEHGQHDRWRSNVASQRCSCARWVGAHDTMTRRAARDHAARAFDAWRSQAAVTLRCILGVKTFRRKVLTAVPAQTWRGLAQCQRRPAELLGPVPAQMWAGRAQSWRRCGRGEPSPGADVGGVSPVPAQMWAGRAQCRRRCGRGEPSAGADVALCAGAGAAAGLAADQAVQSGNGRRAAQSTRVYLFRECPSAQSPSGHAAPTQFRLDNARLRA
jgi:hypothetical protein